MEFAACCHWYHIIQPTPEELLSFYPVLGKISEIDTPKNGTSPSSPGRTVVPQSQQRPTALDCTVIRTVTKSLPCLLSLQLFCTMFWCNTDLVQALVCICCNKIKYYVMSTSFLQGATSDALLDGAFCNVVRTINLPPPLSQQVFVQYFAVFLWTKGLRPKAYGIFGGEMVLDSTGLYMCSFLLHFYGKRKDLGQKHMAFLGVKWSSIPQAFLRYQSHTKHLLSPRTLFFDVKI